MPRIATKISKDCADLPPRVLAPVRRSEKICREVGMVNPGDQVEIWLRYRDPRYPTAARKPGRS